MKRLISALTSGTFYSDSLVSFTSSVLARLLTLVAVTAITRMYPAREFGIWVLILAVTNFFLPFCTLRLELALVLAPTKRYAHGLLLAIAAITLGVTIAVALLLPIVPVRFITSLFLIEQTPSSLLVFVPPLLLMLAIQNTLLMWLTRKSRFRTIGLAAILHASTTAIMVIVLPTLVRANVGAIVASSLVGYAAAIALLLIKSRSDLGNIFRIGNPIATAVVAVKRFSVYPKYMFPQSVSVVFSERLLQFLLAGLFSVGLLGTYFIARQSLLGPASILANSVRNVIFAHGARDQSIAATQQRTLGMLNLLLLLIAPALAWGTFWIGKLALLVFGSRWPELPVLCWYCMFPAATLIFTGPLDRLFDLSGHQRLSGILQIANDVLSVLLALLAVYLGATGLQLVGIISFATVLYNALWLTLALTSIGISMSVIYSFFGRFILLFLLCCTLQYGASLLTNQIASLLCGAAILLGTSIYGVTKVVHRFGLLHSLFSSNKKFSRSGM